MTFLLRVFQRVLNRRKGEGGRGEEEKRERAIYEIDRSQDREGRAREEGLRRAKVPSKHGTGMTRNSAVACAFQADVMRCEAINAPSTRLDLRLHRHEAYSIARLLSRV